MTHALHRTATLALLLVASGAAVASGGADFFRGKMRFEEGRWMEAGKAFAAAGRKGYDPGRVHYWLGRCYLRIGSPRRALKHLEAAIEGGLGDPSVYLGLAQGRKASGETTAALDAVALLLEEEPEHPEGHLIRGDILARSGQLDEAYESLRVAVREHPESVEELALFFPLVQERALVELATLAKEALAREAEAVAAAAAPEDPETEPAPLPTSPVDLLPGFTVVDKARKSGGGGGKSGTRSWSDVQVIGREREGGGPVTIKGKTGGGTTSSAGS